MPSPIIPISFLNLHYVSDNDATIHMITDKWVHLEGFN